MALPQKSIIYISGRNIIEIINAGAAIQNAGYRCTGIVNYLNEDTDDLYLATKNYIKHCLKELIDSEFILMNNDSGLSPLQNTELLIAKLLEIPLIKISDLSL